QANAILDMKLARLNALEVEKINEELNEIELAIADYNDILARPERVREIIKEELTEIKDKYGDPRRSELSYDLGEINIGDLIPKEDVVITTTRMGYIKRLGVKEYKAQNRGGVGITAHKAKEEDFVTKMFVTHSHDDLLFFSNTGRVYCLKAYEVPEAQRATKGRAMVNLLPLSADEKITAFLPVHDYSEGYVVMATKQGLIKKCSLSEFEKIRVNGKIAITLTDGDEMLSADITNGENEILMACTSGKCIRFSENDVRKTGRGSMGVKSISLDEGEVVVDMEVIHNENAEVVTITEKGFGKRTALEEYRLQGRAGKGIKAGNFDENTGNVVNMKIVNPEEENDMIIIADTGIMIRIRVDEISKIGRATKGVRVMRLKGEGKIVSCAIIPHEDLDETKLVGENVAEGEETAPAVESTAETTETANTDNE
ncbi:MAG: DNA gyrase subunit A, partial [Clostridia bacterium]|nr:DNA gyrase subunit A [Clostridia bacterium]